jgi:N6-adenosine-specific RNA methylase IME4
LADVVGTSLDQKGELEALGKLSAADQQDLTEQAKAGAKVSARTVVKQRSREKRDKALAKETEAASERLGNKIYSVIYADPPWRFEPWSRESGMDRAAENHYQTMTVDEICALKIPAAEDSALFLWATPPMEKIAHRVMEAWGFEYRSQLIWDKEKAGTGYWARAQHEHLLIGVKGDVPGPAPGTQPSSVIRAAPTRHSEKPEIFAEIIVAMFPTLPKIELFARKAREGWATWGNEAPEKEAGDRSAKAMPTEAAP